jgi:hypothetical protein
MIKSGKLLLTAILLATGKHNVILRSLCPAIARSTPPTQFAQALLINKGTIK